MHKKQEICVKPTAAALFITNGFDYAVQVMGALPTAVRQSPVGTIGPDVRCQKDVYKYDL